MTECELCGKRATKKAKIEGAVLEVCSDCAKSGEEIFQAAKPAKRVAQKLPKELDFAFVENFHSLVRKARESRSISQQQLAAEVAEKVSLIKRVEEGWEPTLALARKLEKFLNIKMIETEKPAEAKKKRAADSKRAVTIGDIISVKN